MNIFDHSIKADIYNRLIGWGVGESAATVLDGIIILLYLALLVIIINITLRWGVVRGLQWVVHRTRVSWDDILFDSKVVQRLTGIVTPVVIKMMLPLAISALEISQEWIVDVLYKGIDILIVLVAEGFQLALLGIGDAGQKDHLMLEDGFLYIRALVMHTFAQAITLFVDLQLAGHLIRQLLR